MPAPKGNKFAIGNKGTTKMFKNIEVLQTAIDKYFEKCDKNTKEVYIKASQTKETISYPIPYTIEGLCEVMECSRDTLLNYEKKTGYEVYFATIKKAKMRIQRNKLERGLLGESNPALTIFDLKNNHNYKDKTETDTNLNFKNKIEFVNVSKQFPDKD